ncbi:MAG TPA: peptide deformylase [Chloroflexota bacterium]|nr:peptide deformylase [Chloroflexota bacterium]
MAVRPILVLGNPVLRNKARKISRFDQSLERLVQDMIETMREAPGVGLAAPQIGVPLQVAVVEAEKDQVHVLVNPEILKIDGEWEPDEGCLSVPGYWAKIKRGARVTVKARDAKGRELRVTGEGLLGQALQHEIDHLHGLLYLDRLESLDELHRSSPERERHDHTEPKVD